MAKLVLDEEVYQYLGIEHEDDDPHGVALQIRDSVENMLEELTSQQFGVAAEIVDEPHDGHGTGVIFTNRPIDSITSISIRYGVGDEAQYSNLDLQDAVSFERGKRRVHSRDVRFPCDRNNVFITYDAVENQPGMAKQAVREAVAAIFQKIGSEHARSEQVGSYSHVMLRNLNELLSWKLAVESLSHASLG